MTKTTGSTDNYWIELKDEKKHRGLSQSPGTHEKVNLTFGFPFYGHTVSQVHISTAGVISMVADYHDSTVSHYISPFLGHFNPNYSADSAIYFESRNQKFIVEWRNVFLRAATKADNIGPFQFQSVINKNGTIMFLYKKVPRNATSHSTLAGLHSGIYISAAGVKAFVEYKGIKLFADDIHDNTVVVFSPKSICDLATNSKTCNVQSIRFYCTDCEVTKHCSYDTYRHTFEWLVDNCKSEVPPSCENDDSASGPVTKTIVIAAFAAVVLVILAVLSGWFYHAYTRPNSPSGRWLIAHRPSQWIGLIRDRGSTKDYTISSTSKDDEDDPGY